MKEKIKIYEQNGLLTAAPRAEISEQEIKAATKDKILKSYCETIEIYDTFCKNQTTHGQRRKNQRYKKRKQLFKNFSEKITKKHYKIKCKLEAKKIKKLSFKILVIDFDGRQKCNLHSMISGAIMGINTGFISPQYYKIGLRRYYIEAPTD